MLVRVVLDIHENRKYGPSVKGLKEGLIAKYDDTDHAKQDCNCNGYHGRMNQYETGDVPLQAAIKNRLPRALPPMNVAPQQPVYAQVCIHWDTIGGDVADGTKILHAGTVLYGLKGTTKERSELAKTVTISGNLENEGTHHVAKRLECVNAKRHNNIVCHARTFDQLEQMGQDTDGLVPGGATATSSETATATPSSGGTSRRTR